MSRTSVLKALFGFMILILIALVLFTCSRRPSLDDSQIAERTGSATTTASTLAGTGTQTPTMSKEQDGGMSNPISATSTAASSMTPTAQPAVPTTTTPAESPTPITVISPGGAGTATGLTAEAGCGAQGARVIFTWVPGEGSGLQQVDLSNFNNNFINGTYRSSETIPADLGFYAWEGLGDGVQFFWRVRKQSGQSWVTSETEVVETLFCGSDSISP